MANSWIKYFRNESDNELAISLPVSFVDNTVDLKVCQSHVRFYWPSGLS